MQQCNPDDGTGYRQLSTKDLVSYVVGQEKLTQLELELVLRLEQIVEQQLEVKEKLLKLPCLRCPAFPHLVPSGAVDVATELDGEAQWE